MWWIEITDVTGEIFWASVHAEEYKLKNADLWAVPDSHSQFLRSLHEKVPAIRLAQQFRAVKEVAEVRLVEVYQKRPGETEWKPLWEEDIERLGM